MIIFSCSHQNTEKGKPVNVKTKKEVWFAGPNFNTDSAYSFIEKQVSFGPRIPNTANHTACGDWLVKKLNSFQLKTTEQIGEVTAFNMSKLPLRNISGIFNPDANKKVLLCAHWDTRPFADRDSVNKNKPI